MSGVDARGVGASAIPRNAPGTSGVPVELTPAEMTLGLVVGGLRQVTNLRDGRGDKYRARNGSRQDQRLSSRWQFHIEGALGELAVAKLLNVFWSGNLGKLHVGDVGRLEVRTRSRDTYDLPVYAEDMDAACFVLVVGLAPRFRVVGWIRGEDAKRPEWWGDPANDRPAFFVPQAALHSMALLRP